MADSPVSDEALVERCRAAFPAAMSSDVDSALAAISRGKYSIGPKHVPPVRLAMEMVDIPYRVSFLEPTAGRLQTFSDVQRIILACLFSRHHDGHVRQRQVATLVESDQLYVVPFVVQLLGEYVWQISREIADNLESLPARLYGGFGADNPEFIYLTCEHIVSYWSFYWRRQIPGLRLAETPAYGVMDQLGLWNSRVGRRRLRLPR